MLDDRCSAGNTTAGGTQKRDADDLQFQNAINVSMHAMVKEAQGSAPLYASGLSAFDSSDQTEVASIACSL